MEARFTDSRKAGASSLIDLYNFEEPQFDTSQYILTSPRSLKACSQLKIKPVELLHKPLSEFETELKSLGLSHTAVFGAYQKYETQRLAKLQRARDERQRLVVEGERRRGEHVAHPKSNLTITQAEKPGVSPQKQQQTAQSSTLQHVSSKRLAVVPESASGVSSRLADLELVGHSIEVHTGGIQTSAHQQLRLSSTQTNTPNPKTEATQPKSTSSQRSSSTAVSRIPKPRRDPQKANVSQKQRAKTTTTLMAWSDGSVDSSGGAPVRKSKSDQWKGVGRKNYAELTLADVPARDRRILQLMAARRDEERLLAERQSAIALQWDTEKEATKQQQEESERRYRETLDLLNKQSRERRERERLRREDEECKEYEMRRADIEKGSQEWEERAARIEEERFQKIQVKKLEDSQKKRLQEVRLQDKEKEDKILRSAVEERLQEELVRAEQVRQEKEKEKKVHLQAKNMTERQEYKQRRTAVDQQFSDGVDYAKSAVEMKHAHAEERLQQSLAQREESLRMNRLKKIQREQVRQSAMEEMHSEMDIWRQGITIQQQQAQERAEAVAAGVVTEKRQSALMQRAAKEQEHRQQLQRVRQEEEDWRRQVEQEVKMKELRASAAVRDREFQIQQSRQVARATEYMRSKIVQGDGRPTTHMSSELRRPRTTPSKYRTRDSTNFLLG